MTKRRKMKKAGMTAFFHKSQNSERTKDHEIAIHDGDLKRLHNPDTFLEKKFFQIQNQKEK